MLPGAETILVTLSPAADPGVVERTLLRLHESRSAGPVRPTAESEPVTIPVRYDGADLRDVADLLGIGVAEVIDRHTSAAWECRFIGFTAGFGYLTASSAGLDVPRRARSRTAVPAGSVALAGGYSAVYPRRGPGGWQIIGTTLAVMWDLDRAQPSLLVPGTRVRFQVAE